jgi:hypothetical protein
MWISADSNITNSSRMATLEHRSKNDDLDFSFNTPQLIASDNNAAYSVTNSTLNQSTTKEKISCITAASFASGVAVFFSLCDQYQAGVFRTLLATQQKIAKRFVEINDTN